MRRILICLMLLTGLAQADQELLLNYPAPDDWKREVLVLPPDFAPELGWHGKECLRFSPGMFQAEAADFFSYTFILVLEEPKKDLSDDLVGYYSGLSRAVMDDPDLDPSWFRVTESSGSYKLHWFEPFATKSPQDLNLRVERFDEAGKVWFVCASPADLERPIWKQLDLICQQARAVYRENSAGL